MLTKVSITQCDGKKRLDMRANETRLHLMRSGSSSTGAFFLPGKWITLLDRNGLPLQSSEFS